MAKVNRSPWLLHYDGSSCNGCDIEVLACLTPVYDVERFGVVNTGNPLHADILLITGGINSQNQAVVQQIYSQMPSPKVVVAVGACACTGGIFKECYNIHGGVDTTIPVDIYVPGCAARPESIIDGVVKGLPLPREVLRAGKFIHQIHDLAHVGHGVLVQIVKHLGQAIALQAVRNFHLDLPLSRYSSTFSWCYDTAAAGDGK